jgi:hypothetical protein
MNHARTLAEFCTDVCTRGRKVAGKTAFCSAKSASFSGQIVPVVAECHLNWRLRLKEYTDHVILVLRIPGAMQSQGRLMYTIAVAVSCSHRNLTQAGVGWGEKIEKSHEGQAKSRT